MKYVRICKKETDETGKLRFFVDKSFVRLALGRDVAVEKPSQDEAKALEIAVRTVFLGGINEIAAECDMRGVEVVLDQFGAPQLFEESQQTSRWIF